jgi:hypothetical protein
MAAHQGLTAARGGLWTPSSHDLGRCLGRPHLNQECSGSCRLSAQSELGPARPPAHLGPFAGKGREGKRSEGKGREGKGREGKHATELKTRPSVLYLRSEDLFLFLFVFLFESSFPLGMPG